MSGTNAAYMREYRKRCKEKGQCCVCKEPVLPGYCRCQKHHEEAQQREKKRLVPGRCRRCSSAAQSGKTFCSKHLVQKRAEHKAKREQWKVDGRCRMCGGEKESPTAWCERCLLRSERIRRRQKREVMEAYGGAFCIWCNDDLLDGLSIDHVNGDGAAHRRTLKDKNLYRFLRRNGFPPGYRVLCVKCNFILGLYGYLPEKYRNLFPRPEPIK